MVEVNKAWATSRVSLLMKSLQKVNQVLLQIIFHVITQELKLIYFKIENSKKTSVERDRHEDTL